MKAYTNRAGKPGFKPSFDELQRMDEECAGFCLACGNEAYGKEPDACKDVCEDCGEARVYGAAELILMGLFYNE